MRVVIASRIFEPEPSAASFRLQALADELVTVGHSVEVKTVTPPANLSRVHQPDPGYHVTRWPVKRDRQGYVRGYVSYMSFDIPLLFRVLFSRGIDIIVVEPPPTTGVMVRVACLIRRIPYVYYAADVWSDAAQQTGAPKLIVNTVRAMERWAWKGAKTLLSVSTGVTERLAELVPHSRVVTVGNGVNVDRFVSSSSGERPLAQPYFLYAGTASEWHGAVAFVEAFSQASQRLAGADLVFIGGGSDREKLKLRAQELGVAARVHFFEPMPAEELSLWLANSLASLASVRPGSGYDFAFPTKLYSSVASGASLIYAGPGPAVEFVHTEVAGEPLGQAVGYDPHEIGGALIEVFDRQQLLSEKERTTRRRILADWAAQSVSLRSVAQRIVGEVERFSQEVSSGRQ